MIHRLWLLPAAAFAPAPDGSPGGLRKEVHVARAAPNGRLGRELQAQLRHLLGASRAPQTEDLRSDVPPIGWTCAWRVNVSVTKLLGS